MAQRFIDGIPFRIYGFLKREWAHADRRVVQVEIPGTGDFEVTPVGARHLAQMLMDAARVADKAKS